MVRPMRPADFPRFLALADGESWSCDERELHAFLGSCPDGCLVSGEADGFVMAYRHARSAWVANFVVAPERRGDGIGTMLLQTLLERLDAEVPTVYLNAAPDAVSLYLRHGFTAMGSVVRWQLQAGPRGAAPPPGTEHGPALAALDRRCWSDDRSEMLGVLLADRCVLHDLASGGYLALGRVAEHVTIGPFELASPSVAAIGRLLERALDVAGALAGPAAAVLLDVPAACPTASEALQALGGRPISETTTMVRGEQVPVDLERIASLASMSSKG